MASSIWGGLAALGDAAVGIGGSMLKSHLAGMLEKQREARAAEREDSKITGQKIVRDPDGTTWRVGVNAAGLERGERTLASKQEILEFNRTEAAKERKDSKEALDLWLAEQTAADYGTDKELDRRYKQSLIDQIGDASDRGWATINLNRDEHNARLNGLGAYGRGRAGSDSANNASMQDYANLLASDPSTKEYVASLRTRQNPLTDSEIKKLQEWAVMEAERTGVPATTLLLEAEERGESVFSRYNTDDALTGNGIKGSNTGFPGAFKIALPEKKIK